MLGRYGLYINDWGNLSYGWIEPYQLWLPFEHLDFLIGNITRSETPMWKSCR